MKANFLLAATYDVHGRFSPFSPDRPMNIFWADYLGYNKLLTTGFPLENESVYLGTGSKDVDF